jgi:hypothetical protein
MLTRILQFFSGKRVDVSVEEDLAEQQTELRRIQLEIQEVQKRLADGSAVVEGLHQKEEAFRMDLECLLMEIHDPMSIRSQEMEVLGIPLEDAEIYVEEMPLRLRDAEATITRISKVSMRSPSSDEEDPQHREEVTITLRHPTIRNRRTELEFVTIECNDEDESDSDVDDERVAIAVRSNSSAELPDKLPVLPAEPQPTVMYSLGDLHECDFVSPQEWKRWRCRLYRMQQAELIDKHFRRKVLSGLTRRREDLEAKIFEQQCEMIHLKALEDHAEKQLREGQSISGDRRNDVDAEVGGMVPLVSAPPRIQIVTDARFCCYCFPRFSFPFLFPMPKPMLSVLFAIYFF